MMFLLVRTMNGDTISVKVPADATLFDLKVLILAEDSMSLESQITFEGRILNDDAKKLHHYGIMTGNTVHVQLRPGVKRARGAQQRKRRRLQAAALLVQDLEME